MLDGLLLLIENPQDYSILNKNEVLLAHSRADPLLLTSQYGAIACACQEGDI